MGACARILTTRATRGMKKTAAALERKSCWEGGVGIITSSSTIVYYSRRRLSTTGLPIPNPAPRSVGG
jgi:hypothetical protein